ncbi:MAG: hypothetical protein ACO396_10580, partial [Phycisphaerales bacterium]
MVRNSVWSALLASMGVATTAFATNVTWFGPSQAVNSNASFSASTGYTNNYGVAFTTGSSGTFTMSWLDLQLGQGSTVGNWTLTVALHDTTNSTAYSAVAGSTAYATDTVTITAGGTYFTANLTAAQLPNIMSYAMAANTSYALIIYDATSTSAISRTTGYASGTTNDFYTVGNGFTALNTFRNNSTYTNNTNSYPTLGISFGATASALPASGAMAMHGLLAIPGLR